MVLILILSVSLMIKALLEKRWRFLLAPGAAFLWVIFRSTAKLYQLMDYGPILNAASRIMLLVFVISTLAVCKRREPHE